MGPEPHLQNLTCDAPAADRVSFCIACVQEMTRSVYECGVCQVLHVGMRVRDG
jgi:hypothetical protein